MIRIFVLVMYQVQSLPVSLEQLEEHKEVILTSGGSVLDSMELTQ